jgi:hypothetical protein
VIGDPTSSVVPRPHNYGGQVAPSPPLATSDRLVIGGVGSDERCFFVGRSEVVVLKGRGCSSNR